MLPSGLPEHIDDDEDLARFLVQSNQYTATSVKPSAFLPNPKDGVPAAGNRSLHGAAFLKAADVRAARLDVAPAEPPDRHAVIRGWPWHESDPIEQKAQQKELALLLASVAGSPVLLSA